MLFTHILDDRFVEFISGNLYGRAGHDSAKRDHSDVRGPSANVNDHDTVRFCNVKARPDGRCNRLLHQENSFSSRLCGRFPNRSFFHFRDAAGHAYHNSGLEKSAVSAGLSNKILQHSFRYVVIGNNTIPQRSYRNNITWGSSKHLSGFFSHCKNLICVSVDRYNGRLVQDDTLSFYINQNICCSKVDSNFICKTQRFFPP